MLNKHLFPHILCSGTPYEIGLAHGKGAKELIRYTVATYKAMFWDYSGISWERACKYARTFIPVIDEYDPDYMEEIRGIADGSGYSLDDILALNVRSEIVFQGGQVEDAPTDGCTAFVFTPDMTESGRLIIGQNWDWKESIRGGCVVLHIRQEGNKPDITMVTEAGIIGKIGYNSAGIGICLNALGSSMRAEGKTIPLHIAMRGVLDSTTLSDAIRASVRMPLACSAHFMLGSANGEGVSLEMGAGDFDIAYATDGFLAHTNHFFHPRMDHVKDTTRVSLPDSFLRLGRIRKLVKHLGRKVSVSDIKTMMKDHISYPDSICRHDDVLEPEALRLCTVFSIIMDLEREEMYLAPGSPCCSEYHLIKF